MKVFLLGVGAQKAGTTWMHDYLAQSPNADFGFEKEYHVFDTLTLPDCKNFQKRIALQAIKQLKMPPETWMAEGKVRRAAFLADPDLYFEYFAGLLRKDGIHLTGDITPSYSGLSEETLTRIRDGFAKRGIAVRPVFLMRDPVDRLQSMVRMNLRDRKIIADYDQERRAMATKRKRSGEALRSDYARTVQVLDKVFGSAVFYEFYERLFFDDSINRLCAHMGIAPHPANFDVRKNVSKTENHLTPEDRQEFAAQYRKIYKFCAQRFGEGLIEMVWQIPDPAAPPSRKRHKQAAKQPDATP